MKLLLILEHHFYEDKNCDIWCDRVINYDFFRRYLQTFDEICVCARLSYVETKDLKWQKASGSGIRFIPINDFQGAKGAFLNVFNIKSVIRKSIKEADVCILRTPSPISILAYEEIRKSKKPYALEMMMSAKGIFVGDRIYHKIASGIMEKYVKRMCKKADGVAYVTKDILQKQYPTTGFTEVYSSINLDVDDFYKQKWNKEERPIEYIIISTGYMDNKRKGQGISIEAVKILLERGYNVRLVLVGDGRLKREYMDLVTKLKIENKVEFLGLINDKKEIKKRLVEAHVFILPSVSEGLPRSILEAMAVSLPCVASDVDGIPELLDTEYLVHGFEARDYADKVESLIVDWYKMLEVSNKNYERACEYSREILDKRRKKFYDKLASKIM